MSLGKQGHSQVRADCNFTPCVSGEELGLKPSFSSRTGSGPRFSPLSPNRSLLLQFNEMLQWPQEHRRKSLIRDTYATPLESVKHALEKSSVYFPQVTKAIHPNLLQNIKSHHQNKYLVTGD